MPVNAENVPVIVKGLTGVIHRATLALNGRIDQKKAGGNHDEPEENQP